MTDARAEEIIMYLNERTGRQFKCNSQTTLDLINKRISEGHVIKEFKSIIDLKVSQWNHIENMRIYLKPTTLFADHNFKKYPRETTRGST